MPSDAGLCINSVTKFKKGAAGNHGAFSFIPQNIFTGIGWLQSKLFKLQAKKEPDYRVRLKIYEGAIKAKPSEGNTYRAQWEEAQR
ncbi:hypothetical protein ACI0FM_09695 [Paenochrobactrum sp. BZR 588]|uniref:hypothetical protein n=1 Tax=Paenochrobactrum sp. BZR 588 TaxID=3378076 RepID=UPI0038543E12